MAGRTRSLAQKQQKQQHEGSPAHEGRRPQEETPRSLWQALQDRLGNDRVGALSGSGEAQDIYLRHLLQVAQATNLDLEGYLPWNAPPSWSARILPYYRVLAWERANRQGPERAGSAETAAAPGSAPTDAWALDPAAAPDAASRALVRRLAEALPTPAPPAPGELVHEGLRTLIEGRLAATDRPQPAPDAPLGDLLSSTPQLAAEDLLSLQSSFAPYPDFADAAAREVDGAAQGQAGGMQAELAMARKRRLARQAAAGEAHVPGGEGRPLPTRERRAFERALDRDLSRVRVHTDAKAAEAAGDMGAEAFAVGEDIYFGAGSYDPGTVKGDRVLAHELTHVVQHMEGRVPTPGDDGEVTSPSDPVEQEAYSLEDRLAADAAAARAELQLEPASLPDSPLSGPDSIEPGQAPAQLLREEAAAAEIAEPPPPAQAAGEDTLLTTDEEAAEDDEELLQGAPGAAAEQDGGPADADPALAGGPGDQAAATEEGAATDSQEPASTQEDAEAALGEGDASHQAAPPSQGEPAQAPRLLAPTPPTQTPRLGGLPPLIAEPAVVDEALGAAIEEATGMPVRGHHAHLQHGLTAMHGQARGLQQEMATRSDELAEELDASLSGQLSALGGQVSAAAATVGAAYQGARTQVTQAAAAARQQVAGGASQALASVETSFQTNLQGLTEAHEAGMAAVESLQTTWASPFDTMLEQKATLFEETGREKSEELAEQKDEKANEIYPDMAGSVVDRAVQEARRLAARAAVSEAASSFRAGAEAKAEEIRASKEHQQEHVQQGVNGMASHVTQVEEAGKTNLEGASERAKGDIVAQRQGSEDQITGMETDALADLGSDEERTAAEVREAGASLEQDAAWRAEDARNRLTEATASVAIRYEGFTKQVAMGLPKGGFVDAKTARRYLDDREQDLLELHAAGLDELTSVSEGALSFFQEANSRDLQVLQDLARDAASEAAAVATEKAGGFREAGARHAAALREEAGAVAGSMASHLSRSRSSIAAYETSCDGDLQEILDATAEDLDRQVAAYLGDLDLLVERLPFTMQGKADEAAARVVPDLEHRADECYDAMDGWGTDENQLMDALRNLTPLKGRALEVVWTWVFPKDDSLRDWLDGDLSGKEKQAAYAYLHGDTAEGARLELETNMRWYGDDEEQIEKILRDLSDDDREAMKQLPEWEGTRQRLQQNLHGTDIQVTEALLVGNHIRADAYRIRDSIEKARVKGDHDALHEALQGVDPRNLAALHQEFAYIQTGGPASTLDVPPIDQEEATSQFVDFVTRDRKVWHHDPHSGYGHEYTMSLSGPNRDLAVALATDGAGSTEASVARFEVEKNRRGGPDMEKLELALYGDPGLQERLHNPDPRIREQARAEQAEREQRFHELYEGRYGSDVGSAMDEMFRGSKNAEAKQRVVLHMLVDGTNSPRVSADLVHIAIDKWGTDEDGLKRALSGMRPDEIEALRQEYARLHGGGEMESLDRDLGINNRKTGNDYSGLFSELSGEERRDVEELLLGDTRYMDEHDMLWLAVHKISWAIGDESGVLSGVVEGFTKADDNLVTHAVELSRLIERVAVNGSVLDEDGRFRGTPEEGERYKALCRYIGINAENFQDATNRVADVTTTAFAVAAGIVATVASGGTLGPAAAMWLAGITGLGSIGINYGMKGGSYGWEQMGVDLGATAVSLATAGVGSRIKMVGAGFQKTASRAHSVVSKTSLAFGSKFVGGAAGTAMQDGTWDEGALEGLGIVLVGGTKQGIVGATGSLASNLFDTSAFGESMSKGGKFWSILQSGMSGGLEDMVGSTSGVLVDLATGKPVELEGAMQEIGTSTSMGSVKGVMQKLAGDWHKRINAAEAEAATSLTPAPLDEPDVRRLGPSEQEIQTALDEAGLELPGPGTPQAGTVTRTPRGGSNMAVSTTDGVIIEGSDGSRSLVRADGETYTLTTDGTRLGVTAAGAPAGAETTEQTQMATSTTGNDSWRTADGWEGTTTSTGMDLVRPPTTTTTATDDQQKE